MHAQRNIVLVSPSVHLFICPMNIVVRFNMLYATEAAICHETQESWSPVPFLQSPFFLPSLAM